MTTNLQQELEATALKQDRRFPLGTRRDVHQVTTDVIRVPNLMVNIYLVGPPGASDGEWVLVDAGLPGAIQPILKAVHDRFGISRPAAIVLTHGHFDHIGAAQKLASRWEVDVFAHSLEMPYLTGRSAYPPPDPGVEGGMIARVSGLYPRQPIDLGGRIRPLPEDGSVPGMPGWRWIHTPGHTEGHVSFFREEDRTLLAGDAFVTVKQESFFSVLAQHRAVHGPPAYFTSDWQKARDSVRLLADLNPSIAATGHGLPSYGDELRSQLQTLAEDFDGRALPRHGRYVEHPALADEEGVQYVPPRPRPAARTVVAAGLIAAAVAGAVALRAR